MHCKIGDIAIVLPPSRNSGMIVEVLAATESKHYHPLRAWHCRSAGGLLKVFPDYRGDRSLDAIMPDAWLRPVSGLPVDDEISEDLKEPA
jgi:hypothetical protein